MFGASTRGASRDTVLMPAANVELALSATEGADSLYTRQLWRVEACAPLPSVRMKGRLLIRTDSPDPAVSRMSLAITALVELAVRGEVRPDVASWIATRGAAVCAFTDPMLPIATRAIAMGSAKNFLIFILLIC